MGRCRAVLSGPRRTLRAHQRRPRCRPHPTGLGTEDVVGRRVDPKVAIDTVTRRRVASSVEDTQTVSTGRALRSDERRSRGRPHAGSFGSVDRVGDGVDVEVTVVAGSVRRGTCAVQDTLAVRTRSTRRTRNTLNTLVATRNREVQNRIDVRTSVDNRRVCTRSSRRRRTDVDRGRTLRPRRTLRTNRPRSPTRTNSQNDVSSSRQTNVLTDVQNQTHGCDHGFTTNGPDANGSFPLPRSH